MKTNFKFNPKVIEIFRLIKNKKNDYKSFYIPFYKDKQKIGNLKPITINYLGDNVENNELIKLLSQWRDSNSLWYPTVFKVSEEGTKKWLKDQVICVEDRLLFLVETLDGIPIGHMGLYRGEADNFIRGRENLINGGMTFALKAMLNWVFKELKIPELYLRVFSDNKRAIKFYKRCGFTEEFNIPLKKIKGKNFIKWEEITEKDDEAERFFVVMKVVNPYLKVDKDV